MDLERVPAVLIEEEGVSFKYLVFRLESDGQEKILVRGVNFRPYEAKATQRIINWTIDELEQAGFKEGEDRLETEGGGSLTKNPYYEKVVLFGENPEYGAESDRSRTQTLLQDHFKPTKLRKFEPGEEVAPPKPKKSARPARKPTPKEAAAESSPEAEASSKPAKEPPQPADGEIEAGDDAPPLRSAEEGN